MQTLEEGPGLGKLASDRLKYGSLMQKIWIMVIWWMLGIADAIDSAL